MGPVRGAAAALLLGAAMAAGQPGRLHKYSALGNDYLVLDPADWPAPPSAEVVRRLCDRHRGVGADGVLYGPASTSAPFSLRLFNPDGSESGTSGNGLRIFARYVWDRRLPDSKDFRITTPSGEVTAHVLDAEGSRIAVEMGRLSFHSRDIPAAGPAREVLDEELAAGGERVRVHGAGIGNPHCVVFLDGANAALAKSRGGLGENLARSLGPLLETHRIFPQRSNVQFVQVLDRHTLRMEIWERGAGYTLASGSSSCAAAGAAIRSGRCASPVTVRMPGGELQVEVAPDWKVILTGAVEPVFTGTVAAGLR